MNRASEVGFLLIASASVFLASCDVEVRELGEEVGPPSVEKFDGIIASGNIAAFVSDLNEVKGAEADPEIFKYLVSVWNQSKEADALPVLRDGLVRVELASTLAQGSRNEIIEVDDRELHDYLRRSVERDNGESRQRAILAISVFDDPSDARMLTTVATTETDSTFRAAVVALAGMCNAEAGMSLAKLGDDAAEDRLRFLTETVSR